MEITWKNFPLEQVNSKEGPEWKLWEQPSSYPSRGLLALRAGEAAKKQGSEAFKEFHLALLNARHVDRKAIDKQEILVGIARSVGLDVEKFLEDLYDPASLKTIEADYLEARDRYGVFGVPSIFDENGNAAFVKIMPPPQPDEAREIFDEVLGLISERPNIREIKRILPSKD